MYFEFENLIYLPVADITLSGNKLIILSAIAGVCNAILNGIGAGPIIMLCLLQLDIPVTIAIYTSNLCILSIYSGRALKVRKNDFVDWGLIKHSIPFIITGSFIGVNIFIYASAQSSFSAIVKLIIPLISGLIGFFILINVIYQTDKPFTKLRKYKLYLKKHSKYYKSMLISFVPSLMGGTVGSGSPLISKITMNLYYAHNEYMAMRTHYIMISIISSFVFAFHTAFCDAIDFGIVLYVVVVFFISTNISSILLVQLKGFLPILMLGICMILFSALSIYDLFNPKYEYISFNKI